MLRTCRVRGFLLQQSVLRLNLTSWSAPRHNRRGNGVGKNSSCCVRPSSCYRASFRAYCRGFRTLINFKDNSDNIDESSNDEFEAIFNSKKNWEKKLVSSKICHVKSFDARNVNTDEGPDEEVLSSQRVHSKAIRTLREEKDSKESNGGLDISNKLISSSRSGVETHSKCVRQRFGFLGSKKDVTASDGDKADEEDGNSDLDDGFLVNKNDHCEEKRINDVLENEPCHVESLLNMETNSMKNDLGDPDRPLWLRIEEARLTPLKSILETWVEDGNPLSKAVIVNSMAILRKHKKFSLALELSTWVMTTRPYKVDEKEFGVRLELIAGAFGVQKAREYFETIPNKYQTSTLYCILLTIFVSRNMEVEALNLVKKVEKMGLGQLTYMYNQLLFLYKKNGHMKGVTDVLRTMDEKKINPDAHTYNTILDVKARKGDVERMVEVWDQMLEKSVEPDSATYATLAKGYCMNGMVEKAMDAMKKAEDCPSWQKRTDMCIAMRLYGDLGKEEEVERVWNWLVQNRLKVGMPEYIAVLQAMGKVAGAERAEEYFREMERKIGIAFIHQYNALLYVYSLRGLVEKGEKLLKEMAKTSFQPNNITHHHLLQMYMRAGDDMKAMRTLKNFLKASKRPSLRNGLIWGTSQTLLDFMAEKGDVRRAEMIIKEIKNAGFSITYRAYTSLLQAYKVAGRIPYGFLERLRADNIFPTTELRNTVKMLERT